MSLFWKKADGVIKIYIYSFKQYGIIQIHNITVRQMLMIARWWEYPLSLLVLPLFSCLITTEWIHSDLLCFVVLRPSLYRKMISLALTWKNYWKYKIMQNILCIYPFQIMKCLFTHFKKKTHYVLLFLIGWNLKKKKKKNLRWKCKS